MKLSTKVIVFSGLFTAMYVVITLGIAPLSYGPVQLRVANLLNAVVLLNPAFAIAIALGTFLSDLASPFGVWDWGVMPFVSLGAGLAAWLLRRWPVPATIVNAILIALGVSLFPLGQGGGIPFAFTILPVMLPLIAVQVLGYVLIWRRSDIRTLVTRGD